MDNIKHSNLNCIGNRNNVWRHFKGIKIFGLSLLLFLYSEITAGNLNTYSLFDRSINIQQKINGTVFDDQGAPLPGVTVIVVNTVNGAVTDFDGKYTITAQKGDVLQFSFLGMKTLMPRVSNKSTSNHHHQNIKLLEKSLL